ncbi:unnamed protein product [Rotaria sp. Silwood2]|nr:unnamed protein product [Rotaria sp. Silwood2]CAF3089455.1 unnamed protein product [Rotaria sp. Silwood2]CAF3251474.1 unnamed protein product [Rotaria sp. Silwood2]CAF3338659.1 unnamed protein product [Rotaria sp. Silwood2]CAF4164813.1 unnamed protein product [Rotaria sp. Silwood2]
MNNYNFRYKRPQTGDGTFLRLHLYGRLDDEFEQPKQVRPQKTRWLKGIAAHVQQAIVRAVGDRAKGQKCVGKISLSNNAVIVALRNLGIEKKWVS